MRITELLGKKIILFDGAMGTMLQSAGLSGGELSEAYNIENPETVRAIHRAYLEAGSDVVTTNTLGANSLHLRGSSYSPSRVIEAGIGNCKAAVADAGKGFVALDIGPSGKLVDMTDDFDFDDAYELFREQIVAGTEAGADLILFETFTDVVELKAGVLAAKEHSDLPVFCSLTFSENGRTLTGSDPVTVVRMFQDMGIAAIGINCSLGPAETLPLIEEMTAVSKIPVLAQPNAGLPHAENGTTSYDVSESDFALHAERILEAGAAAVGGCCGTTPAYISELSARLRAAGDEEKVRRFPALQTGFLSERIASSCPTACAVVKSVALDGRTRIVGGRINPTGRREIEEALSSGDYARLTKEAVKQSKAGADIVDVNAGSPNIDEEEALSRLVRKISLKGNIPLMIDCKDPRRAERALRYCRGKAIINSVTGERASMDAVFPIAAKYGTAVVALAMDEKGVPASAEERLSILEKLLSEAAKYGIGKDRIIVDMLALSLKTAPGAARETLRAVTAAGERYGVKTILGADNISFGLPERGSVTSAFLSMAVYAGLDAAITDPTVAEYKDAVKSAESIMGGDPGV
ncbi:MAG: homocysteine S-methyltransferase family protein [Clostridiales Family XIII bacterium]|jgi:5-methyltetrahydrofolate--homocysteine methyltransferase|nr:homocysteine S-methyltransferase family protein [Clostridiales Family XIII bacterium]